MDEVTQSEVWTPKHRPQDPSPKCEDTTTSSFRLEFLDSHPFVRQNALDKVYGCIIGSALGDTIGLYTEFLPKHSSETIYADRKFSLVEPVTELYSDTHRLRFDPCAWTDDTDQALLIILSYLNNHSDAGRLSKLPQDFASRLKDWVDQGLLALDRPPCGIGAMVGSVVTHSQFLDNPVTTATGRWINSSRRNAPNGSLMRTHPIGVLCVGLSEKEAWDVAIAVSRTTHVDPRCVVACCISVGIIRGLLRGEVLSEDDVDAAIERAYNEVRGRPELMNPGLDPELTEDEISRLLDRKEFERHVYAKNLEELKLDSAREMGYVYKCLGSAILILRLAFRDVGKRPVPSNTLFEELMTDLVMEGGDADTNGAAAGALLGAYLGNANLPPHWSNGLAHKGWLESKIERVIKVVGIIDGDIQNEADEAADGGKGLMDQEALKKRDLALWNTLQARIMARKEKEEQERKKSKGNSMAGWFKR